MSETPHKLFQCVKCGGSDVTHMLTTYLTGDTEESAHCSKCLTAYAWDHTTNRLVLKDEG